MPPTDALLDARERLLIVSTIRSLGSKGATATVVHARLALESGKSLEAVRRFLVGNSAFVLGGRPLKRISKDLVRKRRDGDDVFVAVEHAWPVRVCACCGGPNEDWYLKGGGFDDNVHAALLRESLPFAVCELCFRRGFYAQNDAFPVGVAVLPLVTTTLLHQQVLKAVSRLTRATAMLVAEAMNLSVAAVEPVLDALADDDQLRRLLQGDSATGGLTIVYCADREASAELPLALSLARQTTPQGLFGFSELTAVRIKVPPSLEFVRKAQDFEWLHDELALLGVFLPSLPIYQHVGRFNAAFLQGRIQVLARFLCLVTTRQPFRSSPATAAFFRPGFDFAKAGVEAQRGGESSSVAILGSGMRASATVVVVSKVLQEKNREAARALISLGEAVEELAQLTGDATFSTLAQACVANKHSAVSSVSPRSDDVVALVRHNMTKAAADVAHWTKVKESLLSGLV